MAALEARPRGAVVEGGLVLLPRLAGQLIVWAEAKCQGGLLGGDLHLRPKQSFKERDGHRPPRGGEAGLQRSYEFVCPGEVGRTALPGLEGCLCALATSWQSRGARLRPRADHEGGGSWLRGGPGPLLCPRANGTLYLETVRHWLLLRPRGDADERVARALQQHQESQ